MSATLSNSKLATTAILHRLSQSITTFINLAMMDSLSIMKLYHIENFYYYYCTFIRELFSVEYKQ